MIAVTITGGLGGCSGSGSEPEAAPTASRSRALFGRSCESRVYGRLGGGWRSRSLVVGPIAFVGASGYSGYRPRGLAGGGRHHVVKILVVVASSQTVTVEVAPRAAARASLAYDPGNLDPGRVDRGQPAVTFSACPEGTPLTSRSGTQFHGGLIVSEPGCVPLLVHLSGSGPPLRTAVSVGAGRCFAADALSRRVNPR
ncbi:MAG: hypothetical protein M3279_07445 [Actinomycetota bacterium]|nr:hypothetical protein [Actinomycetota bacterium]MDQ3952779.1 hypothetical protein [Actinomycetota bacterium]